MEVGNETGGVIWDGGFWEEIVGWWVDASRWLVCRVVFASDITSVDSAFASTNEVVDSLEYCICQSVSALALPPSFDDPTIVTIDLKVGSCGARCCEECLDEEFESNRRSEERRVGKEC